MKGLAKPQMLEYLVAPNRPVIEFQDAFEALKEGAWYLHRKDTQALPELRQSFPRPRLHVTDGLTPDHTRDGVVEVWRELIEQDDAGSSPMSSIQSFSDGALAPSFQNRAN